MVVLKMEGFNALRHDFPKLQQVALGIHSNSVRAAGLKMAPKRSTAKVPPQISGPASHRASTHDPKPFPFVRLFFV